MKNRWVRLVLVILFMFIVFRFYQYFFMNKTAFKRTNKGQKDQVIPVEIDKVSRQDLEEIAVFSGSLQAKSSLDLMAQVNGQLVKSFVNIGDRVKKGQLLAQIDDRRYEYELEKAKSANEVAKANAMQSKDALQVSEREIENQRRLLRDRFISQTEYDVYNSQYIVNKAKDDIAQANLLSAKAVLNSAKLDLKECQIRADWNTEESYRLIGEKFCEEGNMLNKGNPLFSLFDLNSMLAVFNVSEADYTKLEKGQDAKIQVDSYPNRFFQGKIKRFSPVLDEESRQARVEIEIINSQLLLKPGMFAKISIVFNKKASVICVPHTALCSLKGEQGVYLLSEDQKRVHFIKVRTGIKSDKYIEIISPEIKGNIVVLGQDMLDNGKKISLPDKEENRSKSSKKRVKK